MDEKLSLFRLVHTGSGLEACRHKTLTVLTSKPLMEPLKGVHSNVFPLDRNRPRSYPLSRGTSLYPFTLTVSLKVHLSKLTIGFLEGVNNVKDKKLRGVTFYP